MLIRASNLKNRIKISKVFQHIKLHYLFLKIVIKEKLLILQFSAI